MIVEQLKDLKWKDELFLCVNSESFIDKKILEFAKYSKLEMSDIKIAVISNGMLIDEMRMDEMIEIIDQIVINDYIVNLMKLGKD